MKTLADELGALKRYEVKARIAQCVKTAGYVTVTTARRWLREAWEAAG